MSPSLTPKPVVLCILDGWGYREDAADNAISQAYAPNFKKLWTERPHALLDASEEHVGLPQGQIGNSEVGHMNLGAGRVIYQDLPLIDKAIKTGELAKNTTLLDFINHLKKTGGTCHLMGLASPGGVHAHQRHITYLARAVAEEGVPVSVHAFLDGRDVPPQSAAAQIAELQKALASIIGVSLATLCGRYYAMDRDKRWERVEKAYDLLVEGKGTEAIDPVAAIHASYAAGVFDEFVLAVTLNGYAGMKNGDGILFANFRSDRARQILAALLDPDFDGFQRTRIIKFASALGMVEYSTELNKFLGALFPPKSIDSSLGEIIANAGKKQLRIAETEKYPHVTFFFNGGREEPFAGEVRIIVPSPKVATYDLQPEMSAGAVTDKVVEAISKGVFDLVVLNYANPDMVGHTGSLEAAIKAVEAIDQCLGRLIDAVKSQGGTIILTADHGNCEMMTDHENGGPHTAHTLDRVPVILINGPSEIKTLRDGKLADVAPTILELMHLSKPSVMDGQSLIVRV